MTNTSNTTATATALLVAGERIIVGNIVGVGNIAGVGNTAAVGYAFGIGDRVAIPPNFRYAEVFRRGRPRHGVPGKLGTYDSFYIKHPPMDAERRAKIFAPFNALKGYDEAIASKQVLYENKRELTEGEREELDQKMAVLHRMTANSRVARENAVRVSITYFTPCADIHSEWYSEDGRMGQYRTVDGIVQKVDTVHRRIVLAVGGENAVKDGDVSIPVDDIVSIEGEVFRGLHLENT